MTSDCKDNNTHIQIQQYVDQLAFFIKLEFQSAGKFNPMTQSLFVNLDDDLARETLPDIIGDGVGFASV